MILFGIKKEDKKWKNIIGIVRETCAQYNISRSGFTSK